MMPSVSTTAIEVTHGCFVTSMTQRLGFFAVCPVGVVAGSPARSSTEEASVSSALARRAASGTPRRFLP